MKKPKQVVLLALLAQCCASLSSGAEQATGVDTLPPIDVKIAAHAVGDDEHARGVYLFWLKCGPHGSCYLERTTLNECMSPGNQAPAFSARVDSWSTRTGQLTLRRTARNQIEFTVYQAYGKKLPAKLLLTFASDTSRPFDQLAGLSSTGFIDLRFFPDISRLIDYAPVERDSVKVLDCPVSLPGLRR